MNNTQYIPKKPNLLGENKIFLNYSIKEISNYIDWRFFFKAWELDYDFRQDFNPNNLNPQQADLYNDAIKILEKIIENKLLCLNGVCGIYKAASVNYEDIKIYDNNNNEIETFNMLRQQKIKKNSPNYSLADFIFSDTSGINDYLGFFVVTSGINIETSLKSPDFKGDDYNSLMIKIIADRLAEAFSERLHELVRKEIWGYNSNEKLSVNELFKVKYTGIRPAPGYPPCPDHSEKKKIFNLLNCEKIGIKLTDSFMMIPAASVSGYYFAHPKSMYFSIGKVNKDQVKDYSIRKKISFEMAEKFLSPYLNY